MSIINIPSGVSYDFVSKYVTSRFNEMVDAGGVTKLGTNTVGSETQPIYLQNGVPTAITSLLNTSNVAQVKSGALTTGAFTANGNIVANGNITSSGSLSSHGVTSIGNIVINAQSSPGLDIIAGTDAFGHINYKSRSGDGVSLTFTSEELRLSTVKTTGFTNSSLLPKSAIDSLVNDKISVIESEYAKKTELTDGSVTKVGTNTVGSISQPVYLNAGVPIACTNVATKTELTDGSVTKIGTSTVGSVSSPIYLNGGVPTVATNVVTLESNQEVTGWKIARGVSASRFWAIKSSRDDYSRPVSSIDYPYPGFNLVYDSNDNFVIGTNVFRGPDATYLRYQARKPPSSEGLGSISYENYAIIRADGVHFVAPTISSIDAPSNEVANKGYVSATDGRNNLVHNIGSEGIYGNKTFHAPIFIERTDGAPYIRQTFGNKDASDNPESTETWINRESWDALNNRMSTEYLGKRPDGSSLYNLTLRNFAKGEEGVVESGKGSLVFNTFPDGTAELRLQDGIGHNILIATTRS